MFVIEFYSLPDGRQPAKEFISSIDNTKLRVKVYRKLKQLEDFGTALREPDSKYLGDGIFELRIRQNHNTVRCLYFFYVEKVIVLTNGFVKKTQKTPKRELFLALERKADYEKQKRTQRVGTDDPIGNDRSRIPKGMERN